MKKVLMIAGPNGAGNTTLFYNRALLKPHVFAKTPIGYLFMLRAQAKQTSTR